jgi:hypothetical protein
LTWFPDKSLCAKLDFQGLVMKKTSPVVSLDPERGVILMIPLPVKPYSAEKLLVNTVTSLQIQKG